MAAKSNELFEMLVNITGDNTVAKKTLEDLKKEAKELDKQLQGMKLGDKQFEALQMKTTNLKTAIKALERPTDKFARSSKSAATTAFNLSRIIQDMPYGYMAIANNMDVAWESSVRLTKEMGGAKKATKALVGTMVGPTGLLLGVSAVNALVVAFGDDLMAAITGSNDEADNFIDRLDAIAGYTPIELELRIYGLDGLEKIEAQLEQEKLRMEYLDRLERERTLVKEAEPSIGQKAVGFLGGQLGTQAAYSDKRRALEDVRATQIELAESVKIGEETLGSVQANVELMTEYLGIQEEEARTIAEKNAARVRVAKLQIDKEREAKAQADKDAKEVEGERKKAQAAAKRLESARKRREKARQKAVDDALKVEELTYTSIISNIENMVIDDMADLEVAMTGLRTGAIGERYESLITAIDDKIPQIVDELIRKELEAIRNKLVRGESITRANQAFLAQYGGITSYDAGFLGGVGRASAKVQSRGDKLDKELRTFGSLRADYEDDINNIGAEFENTAVDAFDQSVSLFSAQLAAAIFQGGATFTEVLGNVATTFGQMLLQFIIEAFAKDILKSLIPGFFAEGTPAAPPGFAWVGEKGPELVRFQGGEEVVPNNQVGRRLDALYNAGLAAQDFLRSGDVSSITSALDRQTRAMLKDRLNYEITDRGSRQIARATKKREGQIKRFIGS